TTGIRRAVRPSSLARTGARVCGRRTRHTGKQTRDRDDRAIRARRHRPPPIASEPATEHDNSVGCGILTPAALDVPARLRPEPSAWPTSPARGVRCAVLLRFLL